MLWMNLGGGWLLHVLEVQRAWVSRLEVIVLGLDSGEDGCGLLVVVNHVQ